MPKHPSQATQITRPEARIWLKDNFLITTEGAEPIQPLLLVLCSKTGKSDMRGQIRHRLRRWPTHVQVEYLVISFGDVDRCVRQIVEAIGRYQPDLVAIARGGGDPLELARIADSPKVVRTLLREGLGHGESRPYYSALGHNQDHCLVDYYSDECFATPSALGEEIAAIELALTHEERGHRKIASTRRWLRWSLGINACTAATLWVLWHYPVARTYASSLRAATSQIFGA